MSSYMLGVSLQDLTFTVCSNRLRFVFIIHVGVPKFGFTKMTGSVDILVNVFGALQTKSDHSI